MRTVLVRFGGILFLVALAVWLYCLLDAMGVEHDLLRRWTGRLGAAREAREERE